MPGLYLVKILVVVLQCCHVALVDQFFLGFYIVVQAGFGEAQALGDIAQGGSPGALVIKQLGSLGQDRHPLGVVLSRAIKR